MSLSFPLSPVQDTCVSMLVRVRTLSLFLSTVGESGQLYRHFVIKELLLSSVSLLCVPPNLTNFPCISKCGLFSVGVVASDSPYPVSLSAPLCSMRLSPSLLLPSWS